MLDDEVRYEGGSLGYTKCKYLQNCSEFDH